MARSLKRVNAIFATGESNIGRTTMLNMLDRLYYPNHSRGAVSQASMKYIIYWCESHGGKLAKRIKAHADRMQMGERLPFDLTEEAFCCWLENEMRRNERLETLFVTSQPLTEESLPLIVPFDSVSILNIVPKSARSPRNPHSVDSSLVLTLEREDPMLERLDRATHHFMSQKDPPLPAEVLLGGLRRLHDVHGPLYQKIMAMDPEPASRPSLVAEPLAA